MGVANLHVSVSPSGSYAGIWNLLRRGVWSSPNPAWGMGKTGIPKMMGDRLSSPDFSMTVVSKRKRPSTLLLSRWFSSPLHFPSASSGLSGYEHS